MMTVTVLDLRKPPSYAPSLAFVDKPQRLWTVDHYPLLKCLTQQNRKMLRFESKIPKLSIFYVQPAFASHDPSYRCDLKATKRGSR